MSTTYLPNQSAGSRYAYANARPTANYYQQNNRQSVKTSFIDRIDEGQLMVGIFCFLVPTLFSAAAFGLHYLLVEDLTTYGLYIGGGAIAARLTMSIVIKGMAAEKNREINTIKAYLAKNKINAVQSPDGVFVVVKEAGDMSNKVDSTKTASVYYKGYNFKGETFDTNINPKDSVSKPFDVKIATNSVIQGWDIGLQYFGKGGKGSLYIPAMLAYGPQPNGQIKAYENLAFDIEIVNVTSQSLSAAPSPVGAKK
jgi:FKBP-type peptidyl-prolyl cis-trans isomerase